MAWVTRQQETNSKTILKFLGSTQIEQFFTPERFFSTGSRRFSKLKKAASNGDLAPPVDIRYLTKPASAQNSEAKSSASSFLMQVYESVAETLPDYRDETFDVDTTLVSLKEDATENKDPYADQLERGLGPNCHSPSKKTGRDAKNPKLRKTKRHLKLNLKRRPETGGLYEEKWLPPGQMKDIWEQYRHANQGANCASFTTFWRVP